MPDINTPTAQDTRTRLLQAALEVFSRRDFDGVSVREIVDLAGANVAAVSYHFGGKEGLYLATAKFLAEQMLARIQPLLATIQDATATADRPGAAELLHKLIKGLVSSLLSDGIGDSAAGFILREQLQPTAAFDILFERLMLPLQRTYQSLIAALGNGQDKERQQILITHALMGQILAFRVARTTVLRRLGKTRYEPKDVDDIAEQICTLTLRSIAPDMFGVSADER